MHSTWKVDDVNRLKELWYTHTASQIGKELGKTRMSVCGKASRLGLNGRTKNRDFDPHQVPPPRARSEPAAKETTSRRREVSKPAPPPERQLAADLMPQPCTLLALEAGRCHWPLGELAKVATMFCGGVAETGRYCPYHSRIGRAA